MTESPVASEVYRHRNRSRTPLIIAAIAIIAVVAIAATAFVLTRSGDASQQRAATIGVLLEPTSLDVRTNTGVATGQLLIDNVYQGLVGIAAGTVAEIVPVLATELPEISNDGRTFTFTLRDGVRFHSGAALTADDVVDSLQETLTPENIGFEPRIEEVDATTIRIDLAEPNSQLLWQLANFPGLIREAAATNNVAATANGTGPYRFDEWKQGDSLTLVKDDDYWGDEATLETVVFRFFPEGRAAVNALRDGDLDVHTALLPPLREEFENNANYRLERADSTDVFTLAYNGAKAPLNDPRVRTALNLAIDSKALITAQNGDGKPLGGPITNLEPGYEDLTGVNTFDPQAARALLVEAGQRNLSLTITVPNHYDTAALDLIKSQLADIGVAITVKPVDFSRWIEQVYTNRDYQLSYVDHAEARDFVNYANPDYYFGYDNPKVQELVAQSISTSDATEENRFLQEAARLVAADAPAKWLFNYTPTNVIGSHVTGFPNANTNSRINLAGVTID